MKPFIIPGTPFPSRVMSLPFRSNKLFSRDLERRITRYDSIDKVPKPRWQGIRIEHPRSIDVRYHICHHRQEVGIVAQHIVRARPIKSVNLLQEIKEACLSEAADRWDANRIERRVKRAFAESYSFPGETWVRCVDEVRFGICSYGPNI